MPGQVKISGVIITYNEAHHIAECLDSLRQVADELIVVDSFSTDDTVKIAEGAGAQVFENAFKGHIQQKNFAVQTASFEHVLSLDADERLSEEMVDSILAIKEQWGEVKGYSFNRLNNYCGKWLKHAWYPDRKLRLWDRRHGQWGGTNPHDKVIVDGPTKKLPGDILHFAYANLEEHYHQILKFAIIAANAKYAEGKRAGFLTHVLLNPAFKFVKRYLFRFGFLDGYYGFIFSALAAYLNFAKYLRLWELGKRSK